MWPNNVSTSVRYNWEQQKITSYCPVSKCPKVFHHSHVTFLCLNSFRIMFKDKESNLVQDGNNNKAYKKLWLWQFLLLWHKTAEADWQNSKSYLADQTKENSDGSALSHGRTPQQKSWIWQCITWLNTKNAKNRHGICSKYYRGQSLKKCPICSTFILQELQSVSYPTICKSREFAIKLKCITLRFISIHSD